MKNITLDELSSSTRPFFGVNSSMVERILDKRAQELGMTLKKRTVRPKGGFPLTVYRFVPEKADI